MEQFSYKSRHAVSGHTCIGAFKRRADIEGRQTKGLGLLVI